MVSSDFASSGHLALPGPNHAAENTAAPYPWIISPVIDFVFIYGGSFWLLCVLHVVFFGWNAADLVNLRFHSNTFVDEGLAQIFFVMSVGTPVVISNAHTVATYLRIYGTSEDRERFKFYSRYLIFLPIVLLTAALIFPTLQGYIIYLHMMWVFQHYTSQTYGVCLIYCYKRSYLMSNHEKLVFKSLLNGIAAYVITDLLCMRESMPHDMWGVPLPFANLPRPIHYGATAFLVAAACLFAFNVLSKYIREKKMFPIPCLTMILGVGSMGMVTGYASLIAWLWGTPFLHGAQYCLVSLSYSLKERGLPEELNYSHIARALLTPEAFKWMAIAVMGGSFIYIVLPHILSEFGWGFMAMVSVIQGCVNFHHFITDGAIWRLRDPKTRNLLIY